MRNAGKAGLKIRRVVDCGGYASTTDLKETIMLPGGLRVAGGRVGDAMHRGGKGFSMTPPSVSAARVWGRTHFAEEGGGI